MACSFSKDGSLQPECFEAILNSMAEALFIVDTNGIIRFCNHSMETMCGLLSDKLIGMHCHDIMDCPGVDNQECRIQKNGEATSIECHIKCKNGSLLPVMKNGRQIVNAQGDVLGWVETLTDVSLLRLAERKNAVLEDVVNRGFTGIIGKSTAMRGVFDLIDLAAASTATVLITGETGTGKELVARAIHAHGSRSNGPLVKVNCSALPESLLESELFGHVKGAFTGAIKDKPGRFELADGGTLFIDEIGDISPFIQVKLLRFMQEREFERVGESITRKSDVRIIAATNRDLRQLIRSGDFREDLFYRLKVFPIHLPPLRERKEDVGPLITHFITRFNEQTGKHIVGINNEAALVLMDYCWPGNIRELENAIEHAFVTCRESEIGVFDLPLEIRHVELRSTTCIQRGTSPDSMTTGNKSLTRSILADTLARFGGNRTQTARSLGIDRTTLWRYMKRWELNR
jgi:two-component system, NtrC family, response regulator HydG